MRVFLCKTLIFFEILGLFHNSAPMICGEMKEKKKTKKEREKKPNTFQFGFSCLTH